MAGVATMGVDIASYQHPTNWPVALPGVDFVISKSTQGTGYRFDGHRYNREAVRGGGKPHGSYHWLEPAEMYQAPGEIVDQIRWFRVNTPLEAGDLLPVIDVEETHMYQKDGSPYRRNGSPSANDVEFAVRVTEDLFGVTPMLYGGLAVLQPAARRRREVLRCPFWKAAYPGSNNGDPAALLVGPGSLDPWGECVLWQWTSRGSIPGIPGSGLDMDVCYVPLERLMVWGVDQPAQEAEVGLCVPLWAEPADGPGGSKWPAYQWNPPWFRAWHGAPLPDWAGAKPNLFGLPCVEIDATGWLAGHAVATGPTMVGRGAGVLVLRDDGAPLYYPTGRHDPDPEIPAPPPIPVPEPAPEPVPEVSPQELARVVAPHLSITAASATAG